MPYRIRIGEAARGEICHLPGHVRQRVRQLIRGLKDDPIPSSAKGLRGLPGHYRIPLLDWRVIYRVEVDEVIVLVITVRRKAGPSTYENIEG